MKSLVTGIAHLQLQEIAINNHACAKGIYLHNKVKLLRGIAEKEKKH